MLLTPRPGRRTPRDPEAGSALAGVVGILAVTGIVAAMLLVAAVFSTGFTSASRAAVQAHAAAEAGIDYAAANLGACTAGVITSPAGTTPQFSVTVQHRTFASSQGTWAPCAPRGAFEVRLVSTGRAQAPGSAGHARGDSRAMVAVLRNEFPRAVVGDRGIRIAGNLTLQQAVGGAVDMSTNGDFLCNGSVVHSGTLFVDGLVNPAAGQASQQGAQACGRTGPLVQGAAVDPDIAPNVFPRVRKSDLRRWPATARTVQWLATTVGSTGPACVLDRTLTQTVSLGTENVLVDTTTACPNGLTLSLHGTLSLSSDVVIFVDKLTTDANETLNVVSGDGKNHVLFIVKPWPADRVGGCPADPAPDFQMSGNLRTPDGRVAVMLYSSTQIVTGTSSGKNPLYGQIYGCRLNLQGAADLHFVPVGPMLLSSKRDLPVTG